MRTRAIAMCLCLATFGCAVDDDQRDELDEASLTTPEVARVTRPDGSSWRFLEPEPGVLFVWAVLPESSPTTWREMDFDALSYVQIYQRLTSAPVPRALREAQARADAQAGDTDSSSDGGLINEAGNATKGDQTPGISAVDFKDDYCWNNPDFLFCWPSFYGSPYVQRKTYSMHGYVAAVNNTVDFRLRYKKTAAGSWKTSISGQALPGQVHYVYGHYWAYRRWRRWEVLDNGNNLVRYSAQGTE
jgi:hypothetical protein